MTHVYALHRYYFLFALISVSLSYPTGEEEHSLNPSTPPALQSDFESQQRSYEGEESETESETESEPERESVLEPLPPLTAQWAIDRVRKEEEVVSETLQRIYREIRGDLQQWDELLLQDQYAVFSLLKTEGVDFLSDEEKQNVLLYGRILLDHKGYKLEQLALEKGCKLSTKANYVSVVKNVIKKIKMSLPSHLLPISNYYELVTISRKLPYHVLSNREQSERLLAIAHHLMCTPREFEKLASERTWSPLYQRNIRSLLNRFLLAALDAGYTLSPELAEYMTLTRTRIRQQSHNQEVNNLQPSQKRKKNQRASQESGNFETVLFFDTDIIQ